MRPEAELPLYNPVLERLVGEGTLSYETAIRTPQLLALQDHEVATVSHDGTTFVITHQSQELKLKLVAHELSGVTDHLEAFDAPAAIAGLARTAVILGCLGAELAILETLSPASYQVVRGTLGTGSGQESPGYNQVLAVARPLLAAAARVLDRAGVGLGEVYREPAEHPELYALCEGLTSVDAGWQKWLYAHFMLVRRVIGVSTDVESLAANPTSMLAVSMLAPLFPPLWDVRRDMTTDWMEERAVRRCRP
jgi:tryptophan 2,3-dioxygenase